MGRAALSSWRRGAQVVAAACLLTGALFLSSAAGDPVARTAIVGGTPAPAGSYPWQVALVDAHDGVSAAGQFCGGTLISPTKVVTAAHCTYFPDAEDIDVVAGATDLRVGGQRVSVTSISSHPKATGNPYLFPLRYDVSVMTLSAPIAAAVPLMLVEPSPSEDDTLWGPGKLLTIIGWGGSVVLREARVPRISDAGCLASDYGTAFRPDDMVCAGYPQGGIDTCQGDSGGGLLAPTAALPSPTNPDDWRLVGVTSFGVGCALAGKPGVYARLAGADFAAMVVAKPVPQAPPVLSGEAVEGGRLSCGRGTWGGDLARFSYRFQHAGATQSLQEGASAEYTLRESDVGKVVVCLVTARNAGGQGQAESAGVGPIAPRPVAPQPPAAPGDPAPADPGTGDPAPPGAPPTPLSQGTLAASGAGVARAAPRAGIVGRACGRRTCELSVLVSNASGAATLEGTLRWTERRRCRARADRTCLVRRARRLSVARRSAALFRVRTGALARRRAYTVALSAGDVAGNEQLAPTTARLRLPRVA